MVENKQLSKPKELLRMVGIHKYYGRVHVLKGVDFTVNEGEIVGLVGDNGAGKSTLIKTISGFHNAEKGRIYFNEKEVKIKTPGIARKLGIETVYQEQALAPNLNIPRNIFMGRELVNKFGLLRKKEMDEKSNNALKSIRLKINSLDVSVSSLSGGQRQGVAIARALYFKARLVILDEPTVAISVREVQEVLDFVSHLKEKGVAVIFISHNLQHVYSVADRVVVMVQGQKSADVKKENTNVDNLFDLVTR